MTRAVPGRGRTARAATANWLSSGLVAMMEQ
jgi:hypothetical protein